MHARFVNGSALWDANGRVSSLSLAYFNNIKTGYELKAGELLKRYFAYSVA